MKHLCYSTTAYGSFRQSALNAFVRLNLFSTVRLYGAKKIICNYLTHDNTVFLLAESIVNVARLKIVLCLKSTIAVAQIRIFLLLQR